MLQYLIEQTHSLIRKPYVEIIVSNAESLYNNNIYNNII